MKRFLTLLTIGLFLFSCEKPNENPQQPNTNFNKKILDGYFVTSIAFDKLGNAWIGTLKQGLIKYNTSGVTIYNSTNSIISDTSVIWDLAIDSKNNVWIACEGLIKCDGNNFTLYNTSNSPIPEDFVKSIAIDSKDNIWFSSCRFKLGGIVKYDNSTFTVFTPDNSELPFNSVQSIAIDKNDNVWVAVSEYVNASYLVKISGGNWTIYSSDHLGFTPYYFGDIKINSKNKVCGSINYMLSSATCEEHETKVFIFDGNSAEQLQHDSICYINYMTVDKDDNIWCGLVGGDFAVYNGQKWIIDNSSIPDAGLFTIEQAPDNKIWIGTGDGIYIND